MGIEHRMVDDSYSDEWVRVCDRLPEDGQTVYVIADDRTVISIATYKDGEWKIYKGNNPTHWCPVKTTITESK
jgi:hypothetical protein